MTLRIKACTVNKLVEHITTSEPTSETFRLIQIAILTCRTIVAPAKLLSKLFQRYDPPPAANLDPTTTMQIRRSVVRVLEFWLKNMFVDFSEGNLAAITRFVDDIGSRENDPAPSSWVKALRDAIINETNAALIKSTPIQDVPTKLLRVYGETRTSSSVKTIVITPYMRVIDLHRTMLEKFDGAAEDLSLYSLYEVTDSGRRKSTETEYVWDFEDKGQNLRLEWKETTSEEESEEKKVGSRRSLRGKKDSYTQSSFMVNETQAVTKRATSSSVRQTFFKVEAREIALCLTVADAQNYAQIQPKEWLQPSWSSEDVGIRAPNIMSMINQFNNVSLWVMQTILNEEKPSDRAVVVAKIIQVGEHLLQLRDFHSLMAVIAGLMSSPIGRLKATWAALSKKSYQSFLELETILSPHHSYRAYRTLLNNGRFPSVPYIGLTLQDLTAITEGNPNKVNGLINIAKRRLYHRIMTEIRHHQKTTFAVQSSAMIGEFMRPKSLVSVALMERESNMLYDLSLEKEPRAPKA
eukprot:TRINITY_DN41627_c0_g1_i1.p1 TRINITY_DN41627_c0_g1~~TRINITY_DN41627_c0_g1_i1.p1  ORF type:complete len:611 (-),score=140.13 TRINITY_DN41627_c0_g1_i1:72-1637(-)